MNSEIKQAWLSALRGGEYIQGAGALKRELYNSNPGEYEFCCLGVLAEISGAAWETSPIFRDHAVKALADDEMSTVMPPASLLEQYGLTEENANHLAEMNDNGDTFGEIADYIEESL